MSLRFILGRAGSGKSYTCLKEIKEQLMASPMGPSLVFLVPEQATFQIEHSLTADEDLGGLMRAEVLSFHRLAHRVLGEVGGITRIPIGELGKRMVLRDLLEVHKEQLKVFNRCCDRPGFTDSLARSIGEFKIYQLGPEHLAQASAALPGERGLLKDKLADLSLLFDQLNTYLAQGYTDPDDHLNHLAERIVDSNYLRDAEIWVDGFTGFTPQELHVLQKLMGKAKRVNVALCLDPQLLEEQLEECDLFYPTWETYQAILGKAREAAIDIEEPLNLQPDSFPRFKHSDALRHLEEFYFQYPTIEYSEADYKEELKLLAGANRRAEVEAVARQIIDLSREKGYRWREMAIAMRDLAPYHDLIKTVFLDYGIPYFIDQKRGVMHHPLIELIRSGLDVVISDWSYEAVFRYLKTDLPRVTRDEVDQLENYCLAYGIKGYQWLDDSDWTYRRHFNLGEDEEISLEVAEELARINSIRRKATQELRVFTEILHQATGIYDITKGIFDFLEALEVPATLELWSKEAQESGALEKAKEHSQVWNQLLALMDEMVKALGEKELDLENYLAILDVGFQGMELGLIPPGLDQVLIGSLDRTRNPNLKAVFVMGATEGVLPARPNSEGVFNDNERNQLIELGIQIAPGGRRKVFEEQYLIYLALTRAAEALTISYPMADDEGRALGPSVVISRLKNLYPDLQEQIFQVEPITGLEAQQGDLDFIVERKSALGFLASRLRELKAGRSISRVWWDLYNWLLAQEEGPAYIKKILEGVIHENQEAPINKRLSGKLFGKNLRTSVSRIEKFNACPFSHFANYGLKLKERKVYQLAAPDMGEFFHAALKGFVEYLNQKQIDWATLDEATCRSITSEVVDGLTPQLQSAILLSSGRYRHISKKLKKTVTRAALILTEHAKRSSFRPIGLELAFGPEGDLPPVTVAIDEESMLQLVGRIDRIDLGQVNDQNFLRVIDYKSSDSQLKLDDVYYGLKLQLLTYLHVVLSHNQELLKLLNINQAAEALPGGILYFTVKEPLISSSGPLDPVEIEKERLKKLKMKGLLLADPSVIQAMDNALTQGHSELLPVGLKKDGTFYGTSSVITLDQFQLLQSFLETSFRTGGAQILQGEVGIKPYQKGSMTACVFCNFKPVCKFDLLLEDNQYRNLPKLKPEQVWTNIKEGGK